MTAAHATIARDFEPADLRPLLDACGIDRTVLVQSACTDGDTMRCSPRRQSTTGSRPSPRGSISSRLRRRRRGSTFWRTAGVARDSSPDPRGARSPLDPADAVLESLAAVEERGLVLELPCVFPRHLGRPARARAALPASDDRDRPPRQAAARHGADGRLGRDAPPGGRASERLRQGLRAQHDAASRVGSARICSRRSRSPSSASAPTGSCAGATGRSRC